MTIDQLNEIQEWLSPLNKYPTISCDLAATGVNHFGENTAKVYVNTPSQIIALYLCESSEGIQVETPDGTYAFIAQTSIWEQICLRNL